MTDTISLSEILDKLEEFSKYLSEEHLHRLRKLLIAHAPELVPREDAPATADVLDDLMLEVNAQMNFVKQLRNNVTSGGAATTREIKDMVQATSSLFTMLTKMNETVTNQDRLRKIELATLEAVKELPPEAQNAYFDKLEELLSE